MAAEVEQLHYTWAPRGVEGANRFQIAAMSAGFKGHMRSALPVVRKICRYDRPKRDRTANPVSFGWFDHRHHRIAFCRVGLPPTRGKVANFAAHVIAGPPSALQEGALASTFGSPFWWSGLTPEEFDAITAGRREFVLPAVDFDEILDTRVPPHESELPAAVVLARGLLTLPAQGRLAVGGGDQVFGSALRIVGTHLPEALEGRSLSTYEGAPTFPFRIVGTDTPTPRQQQCSLTTPEQPDDLSRATLERLLSAAPRHAALRKAVRAQHTDDPQDRREVMWSRALEIVRIVTRAAGADEIPVSVATAPDVVAYLAREPLGRECLVNALHAGTSGVSEALRFASEQISEPDRDALYAAIAARYGEGRSLHGCASAARAVVDSRARGVLLDGILKVALADGKAAHGLGPNDAAMVIAAAVRRGVRARAAQALLHSTARHVGRCVTTLEIPDDYLAVMFRHRLVELQDARTLADVLEARPGLLGSNELSAAEKDRCIELLAKLDAHRLPAALTALLPHVADGGRASQIVEIMRGLPKTTVARCLVDASAFRSDVPPELSALYDDVAAALLRRSLVAERGDARRLQAVASELLGRSRSTDHPLASELLDGLLHSSQHAIRAAREAAMLRNGELRKGVGDLAIHFAIGEVRRAGDFADVWQQLRAAHTTAGETEGLRLLLQHALRRGATTANALLLGWVARDLLPVHPKLVTIGRHLRDRESDQLARDVVAGIPLWHMEEVEPYVKAADRRYRGWWYDLLDHRRVLEKERAR